MLIAIPAFRVSCNVGIDKGRAWSVIEEIILWSSAREPQSIAKLVAGSGLPRQVVVAAIARLMRFRLVELSVKDNGVSFRTSAYGREIVESGRPLPFFPKREKRRVSFVVEQATGAFFPSIQVRMASHQTLINDPDPDVRFVVVEGGGPSMTHEANMDRLSEIAARGWEEHLAIVDGRTAVMRNEFMLIRFVDGVPRNIPEGASETLKAIVREVSSKPAGTPEIPVGYRGEAEETEQVPIVHACEFDPADVVIGGSAQLTLLKRLFEAANSRVIIHSTFLDHKRFKDLIDDIRSACLRGVRFDLLWGAGVADDTENRNAKSAVHIAGMVREHREIYQNFQLHMRTTGSHAKILLADDAKGDWIAAIGSCNWLSSPFNAVEATVVLRDPHVVADVAVAVQRMVGRRGLSDDIATEMSLVARELRALPRKGGAAKISLIVGDGHDVVMRRASGEATRRMVVGTNRLGSTARPGMLMPAEVAAKRATNMDIVMLYTQASGPLKNRHARKLAEEAALSGMRLLKAPIPLHGKFVVWDSDNLVVTSLNWGSATSDADFPQAEIGVHVESTGIADGAVAQLQTIFPDIARPSAQTESATTFGSKSGEADNTNPNAP